MSSNGTSQHRGSAPSATDNVTFLAQSQLFKGLSQERLAQIASRIEERHYSRGDVIIRQGTPASDVFFIKDGMVEISRVTTVTQERHILAYLKRGDLLGEVAALSNFEGLASATATAITQVDLLVVKAADFISLLEAESGVALALSRLLARRLKATTEPVA